MFAVGSAIFGRANVWGVPFSLLAAIAINDMNDFLYLMVKFYDLQIIKNIIFRESREGWGHDREVDLKYFLCPNHTFVIQISSIDRFTGVNIKNYIINSRFTSTSKI